MDTVDQLAAAAASSLTTRQSWSQLKRGLKAGTVSLREAFDHPASRNKRVMELLGLASIGAPVLHAKGAARTRGQRRQPARVALELAVEHHVSHYVYVHEFADYRRDALAAGLQELATGSLATAAS